MSEELNVKNEVTEGAKQSKLLAILSYISILVFVPLIAAPKSNSLRLHVNQGLVLFTIAVLRDLVVGFCYSYVSLIAPIVNALFTVIGLAAVGFAIAGIIFVCCDVKEELPFIGKINIVK